MTKRVPHPTLFFSGLGHRYYDSRPGSLGFKSITKNRSNVRPIGWLAKKSAFAGDWVVRNSKPEPSGWCFEFNNPYNPDVDDTAMVLLALRTAGYEPEDPALYERGLNWLLSFQCKDGGWAAFDKDVTNRLLE